MEEEKQSEGVRGKSIENNSEILFIYDAKMCNPNGDPDDENKPRMDYNRSINLVSDVRLKRYIRDYLIDYKEKTIFVSKVGGETVDATNRLKKLIEENREEIEADEKLKDLFDKNKPAEKNLSKHMPWLLSKLTDVRFFGATMPLKSEGGRGASITFTGPIQFNWGYSLNKVTGPMESSTITSTFAGAGEEYSTMGKDYRVDYSLIAFHGIISAKRAGNTKLTDDDIDLFDEAMVKAIPLEATTRSKTGQNPLLYIRVEYNTPEFFLGDFRRYVKIAEKGSDKEMPFDGTAKLRSTGDYKLDLAKLKENLREHGEKISKIHFWKSNDIEISGLENQDGKLKAKDSAGKEIEIPIVALSKTKEES
jgi:CRISPR-associated protein Csh2